MSASNEWQWSQEHQRYYRHEWNKERQAYDCIWYGDAQNDNRHRRVDSHGNHDAFTQGQPQFQGTEEQPTAQTQEHDVSSYSDNMTSQTSGQGVVNSTTDSGEGQIIQGKWNPQAPSAVPSWEELDPSYYVRNSDFFVEGKMFSVLFAEPCGVTAYNDSASYLTSKINENIYAQIRRFIVVQRRQEFCYACPVFTYNGRGTLKSGVRPWQHAIVYSSGYSPTLLPGENQINKLPIEVCGNPGDRPLQRASRIYFGIHHPIQYNVKVKDLGQVLETHIPRLIGYWRGENGH